MKQAREWSSAVKQLLCTSKSQGLTPRRMAQKTGAHAARRSSGFDSWHCTGTTGTPPKTEQGAAPERQQKVKNRNRKWRREKITQSVIVLSQAWEVYLVKICSVASSVGLRIQYFLESHSNSFSVGVWISWNDVRETAQFCIREIPLQPLAPHRMELHQEQCQEWPEHHTWNSPWALAWITSCSKRASKAQLLLLILQD